MTWPACLPAASLKAHIPPEKTGKIGMFRSFSVPAAAMLFSTRQLCYATAKAPLNPQLPSFSYQNYDDGVSSILLLLVVLLAAATVHHNNLLSSDVYTVENSKPTN